MGSSNELRMEAEIQSWDVCMEMAKNQSVEKEMVTFLCKLIQYPNQDVAEQTQATSGLTSAPLMFSI